MREKWGPQGACPRHLSWAPNLEAKLQAAGRSLERREVRVSVRSHHLNGHGPPPAAVTGDQLAQDTLPEGLRTPRVMGTRGPRASPRSAADRGFTLDT